MSIQKPTPEMRETNRKANTPERIKTWWDKFDRAIAHGKAKGRFPLGILMSDPDGEISWSSGLSLPDQVETFQLILDQTLDNMKEEIIQKLRDEEIKPSEILQKLVSIIEEQGFEVETVYQIKPNEEKSHGNC